MSETKHTFNTRWAKAPAFAEWAEAIGCDAVDVMVAHLPVNESKHDYLIVWSRPGDSCLWRSSLRRDRDGIFRRTQPDAELPGLLERLTEL